MTFAPPSVEFPAVKDTPVAVGAKVVGAAAAPPSPCVEFAAGKEANEASWRAVGPANLILMYGT